jgi:hypothetical protein
MSHQHQQVIQLEEIPNEIILDILNCLDIDDMVKMSSMSTLFNEVSKLVFSNLINNNDQIKNKFFQFHVKNNVKPVIDTNINYAIAKWQNLEIVDYPYNFVEKFIPDVGFFTLCSHCKKFKQGFTCKYCNTNPCGEYECGREVNGSIYCHEHFILHE